jgi:hypothetical protein
VRYFGGLAYFLIFNSLITRVPLAAKPVIWPIVKPIEIALGSIPMPSIYPCFLAKWRRTSAPISTGNAA